MNEPPAARHYDVAVVGLGPVGATLANLLGICGVKTLVLERESAIHDLPRAVHFDDEVMRVFQTIGVAHDVAAVSRVNPGMRFVDPEGELLLDWPRPQGIGPQGWNTSYRFHQPDLERILRQALTRFDTIEVRTGTTCVHISDQGPWVQLQIEDTGNGCSETVSANYVVGCDGARSFVRNTIGAGHDDFGFNERWLVVDVLLTKPRPDLGDHTIQYCDPARPSTYVRGPGNRRRWEIALREDESCKQTASDAAVWNFLARWLTPGEADLERRAVYEFRSVITSRWRSGGVLLAGDAAHQTPPFMGQGMCAGIRDAANLAWKLAACACGAADDSLLDSYETERIPHVREYIETAARLGRLINTSNTSAALEAAFPQADGSARMASISPPLGPGVQPDDAPPAGHLSPQPQLSGGALIDDVCGYRFALIVEDALRSGCSDAVNGFGGELPVFTDQSEPGIRQYLDQLGTRAVLVRPDRYILGTAESADELAHLLKTIPWRTETQQEGR